MIKTKRTLREMEENLSRLKGGIVSPIKSPYRVQIKKKEAPLSLSDRAYLIQKRRESEFPVKTIIKPVVPESNELVKKIEKLHEVIDGMKKDYEEFVKSFKIGGKNQLEMRDIKNMPLNMNDLRWHGGGDTVTAGSNITITTNSDGQKVIASTGGGGGFTLLPATGIVNGGNTAFTFTEKPDYIVSDGVWYVENIGWTWSVLTATMTVPPSDKIFGFT